MEVEEALCRGGRTPNGCSSVRQVVLTLKCPVTRLTAADHCWLEGTLRLLPGLAQKYLSNEDSFGNLGISCLVESHYQQK